MKIAIELAIVVVFLVFCVKIAYPQSIPSYLMSNDIPYHSEEASLTFDIRNSSYVQQVVGKWTYKVLTKNDHVETRGGFAPMFDSLYFTRDNAYAFKATFYSEEVKRDGRIVLRLPEHPCKYRVFINSREVNLPVPSILGADCDIQNFMKAGENDVLLLFDSGCDEYGGRRYLDGIYLCYFQKLHISNLVVRGGWKITPPDSRAHMLGQPGFLASERIYSLIKDTVSHCFVLRSLYQEGSDMGVNFLSYQTNTLVHDSLDNPYAFSSFKFVDKRPPQDLRSVFMSNGAGVTKWSVENPTVYNYTVQVFDESQELIEVNSARMGFRDVAVKMNLSKNVKSVNRELLVNGKRVLLKGLYYAPGVFSTRDKIKRDIADLKMNNFNAIYTKASVINKEVLNVCDDMGVYVLLDVTPTDYLDPAYPAEQTEILTNFFYKYVNHPSLTLWVIRDGQQNASYYAEINRQLSRSGIPVLLIAESQKFLKQTALDRVVAGVEKSADSVLTVINDFSGYPLVLFDALDSPVDPSDLKYIDATALSSESNLRGIVVNRQPLKEIRADMPLLEALRYRFANVEMEWIDNTAYSVYLKNNFQDTNLSEFVFDVELFQDGRRVAIERLTKLDLAPGMSTLHNLSLDHSAIEGVVYELRMTCRLKTENSWARAGHVVARKVVSLQRKGKGLLERMAE